MPHGGRWVGVAVLAGLALRAWHYLRGPSVWHDEAALLVNALDKPFADLLAGRLGHAEAAPPLFAALTRASALLFGENVYALRLPAFLASCAALLLVAFTARRVLAPAGAALAVGLFAASDRLLWHACEAKPYAFDALAAAGLLALHAGTAAKPLAERLLLFAAAAPVVVWTVFPGGFLYGGVLLALLPEVWSDRRRASALAYGLLAALVAVSFLALVVGPVRAQRCEGMDACWTRHFPDWSRPAWSAWWAVYSTFEVARYCLMPLGQILLPVAVAGGVALARSGRGGLAAAASVPLALAFLAACLHKYPYGGARVEVFAAPGLCLLAGAAAAAVAAPAARAWLVAGVLALPAAYTAWHAVVPWPRADCASASAYVQCRWRPGDVVTADHWEYEFYFRRGPETCSVTDLPACTARRAWVVLTGMDEVSVAALQRVVAERWSCRSRRDFEAVVVLELERRDAAGG